MTEKVGLCIWNSVLGGRLLQKKRNTIKLVPERTQECDVASSMLCLESAGVGDHRG